MDHPPIEGIDLSKIIQVMMVDTWMWIDQGSFEEKENGYIFTNGEGTHFVTMEGLTAVRQPTLKEEESSEE